MEGPTRAAHSHRGPDASDCSHAGNAHPSVAQTDIRYRQIQTHAELALHLPALRDLYRACFGVEPYNEYFKDEEIDAIWNGFLDKEGLIFLAFDGDTLIGFASGYGLAHKPDVAEYLKEVTVPERTFYQAELGVNAAYRRHGIGMELIALRLANIDPSRYDTVMMRTSVDSRMSASLYEDLGFTRVDIAPLPVIMRRQDGTTREDYRFFMKRKLRPDGPEE